MIGYDLSLGIQRIDKDSNLAINSADINTDVVAGETVTSSGLELKPIPINISDNYHNTTLWIDSSNSNKLMLGSNEVGNGIGTSISSEVLYNLNDQVKGDASLTYNSTDNQLTVKKLQISYSNPLSTSGFYSQSGARLADHAFTSGEVLGGINDVALHSTNGATGGIGIRSYQGIQFAVNYNDPSISYDYRWLSGSNEKNICTLTANGEFQPWSINLQGSVSTIGINNTSMLELSDDNKTLKLPYHNAEYWRGSYAHATAFSVGYTRASINAYVSQLATTSNNAAIYKLVDSTIKTGFITITNSSNNINNFILFGHNCGYDTDNNLITYLNGRAMGYKQDTNGHTLCFGGSSTVSGGSLTDLIRFNDSNTIDILAPLTSGNIDASGVIKMNNNNYAADSDSSNDQVRLVGWEGDSSKPNYRELLTPTDLSQSSVSANLRISTSSSGEIFMYTSSKRYKQDITIASNDIINSLYDLEICKWHYKTDVRKYGEGAEFERYPIAEQAYECSPEFIYTKRYDYVPTNGLVESNNDDNTYNIVEGINQECLVSALIQTVQRQHNDITNLEVDMSILQENYETLQQDYVALLKRVITIEGKRRNR